MPFIPPALASPFPAFLELGMDGANGWYAEEKFDGHRLIVESSLPLRGQGVAVRAWSRDGKDRLLPPHLRVQLEQLPIGIYDGELTVPGQRSYDVVALENIGDQVFIMFDVLQVVGRNLTTTDEGIGASYLERRSILGEIVSELYPDLAGPIRLAHAQPVGSPDMLSSLARDVWARDGEGLIVKHSASTYRPGKRLKHWLKVKQLRSAVLQLVGFKAGKMGPYSIAILQDGDGNQTAVKWKDFDWLTSARDSWIGRPVRIEFQERTPDGSYRHPRWDRFEDE